MRVRPEPGGQFRLEVEDTGIGIRPEDLARLFVEFQQLDASAAKKLPGHAASGLALTKRIVEAQGGRVGVRARPARAASSSPSCRVWPALPRWKRTSRPRARAPEAPPSW